MRDEFSRHELVNVVLCSWYSLRHVSRRSLAVLFERSKLEKMMSLEDGTEYKT
jgi:hypothetical protein